MKNNNTLQLFGIAFKLLVICTIVAVIVAFVNFITKDKIRMNELQSTADALTGIYAQQYKGCSFKVVDNEGEATFEMQDNDGNTYLVCKNSDCTLLPIVKQLLVVCDLAENPVGFCVNAAPMGFKDKINMLVAVNSDLTVKSVKIVSLSETSGIGTKIQEQRFLDSFINKSKPVAKQVDIISGATKSSKPVIDAVDKAIEQVEKHLNNEHTKTGGAW